MKASVAANDPNSPYLGAAVVPVLDAPASLKSASSAAYTRGVDEAAAVRAAADAFWAALRTGDGATIASLMSPKAREELVQAVRRWLPAVSTAEAAAARVWGGSWSVPRFVTEWVELDGARAVARWDIPDLSGESDEDDYIVLVKLDGRWVVDSFPDDDDADDRPIWAVAS
jgi:hypothetical protein